MPYQHNFIFLLKTYAGDLNRSKQLLDSYGKFNSDSIPLFLSVPQSDISLFTPLAETAGVTLLTDEELCPCLIHEAINDFQPGYINQQMVKLTFSLTEKARFYLCLDADFEFIREFSQKDFLYDDNTPYSVLTQDKDLSLDKSYRAYYFQRKTKITSIFSKVGLETKHPLTCHNGTVFSSELLASFFTDYTTTEKLPALLNDDPFEFSWYNAWLQKSEKISYKPCEPFFKMFHTKEQYYHSLKECSLEDIKKEYVGLCINSNWGDRFRVSHYGDIPKNKKLAFAIEKKLTNLFLRLRKL